MGVSNSVGFSDFTPFALTASVHAGLNTLDFIVENAYNAAYPNADNPTGLRVEFTGATVAASSPNPTAVAPAPATLWAGLALFGGLGLMQFGRRLIQNA